MHQKSNAKSSPAPVESIQRIIELDVTRGIALFGILVVNSLQMFIPAHYAGDPVAVIANEAGVWSNWFVINSLFDLKFLALFSILFAIGFSLQWSRNDARPSQFRRIYLRRLALLAAFGLAHAALLYAYDVLFLFALSGFLLYLCRNWQARTLIAVGTGLIFFTLFELFVMNFLEVLYLRDTLASIAILAATLWLFRKCRPLAVFSAALVIFTAIVAVQVLKAPAVNSPVDSLPEKQAMASQLIKGPADSLETSIGVFPRPISHAAIARIDANGSDADRHKLEQAIYQSGTATMLIDHRLETFSGLMVFILAYLLWRTLGVFMVVAGLLKLGKLERIRPGQWRRWALWALLSGIAASLMASCLQYLHFHGQNSWLVSGRLLHELSSHVIAFGLLALVFVWSRSTIHGAAKRLLSAAGKTALSNYIGQSAITAWLATSGGLALFGKLGHWQLTSLSLLIFLVLAGASLLWLQFFRMGPLEWIWRCLSYGRVFPIRHTAPRPIKDRYGDQTATDQFQEKAYRPPLHR